MRRRGIACDESVYIAWGRSLIRVDVGGDVGVGVVRLSSLTLAVTLALFKSCWAQDAKEHWSTAVLNKTANEFLLTGVVSCDLRLK